MEIRNCTLANLEETARSILKFAGTEKVFAFYGDLGSGKSTVIREICRLLGVIDETSSPTFSIINEYRTNTGIPLYHFDFYRVRNSDEAHELGSEDYFFSGNFCFIEWPEIVVPFLPETFIKLELYFERGNRTIKLKKVSDGRKR